MGTDCACCSTYIASRIRCGIDPHYFQTIKQKSPAMLRSFWLEREEDHRPVLLKCIPFTISKTHVYYACKALGV